MKIVFTLLLFVSFGSHAVSENHIINKAITTNCKGYVNYQLPSGHKVDCIDKDTIWHYGFAKDHKIILDRLMHIESITKQDSQIVFICSDVAECNQSADKINNFTTQNNLKSIQMSALVIP